MMPAERQFDIQIQKLELPGNLEAIRALLEMLNGNQERDEALDEFRRCLDDVYAAYTGEQLVGFVSLSYPYWNRVGIVDHIAVLPGFRHQGIGRRLIEFIDSLARASRLRILTVQTASWNKDAIAFYESQGFHTRFCFHEYMGPNNDLVWLDKAID